MTRGRKQSNNYEREMTPVVALEAVSKNYELPLYLLPSRARTKAETTWTTDRLGAQIRIYVRGRPRGSTRVKENFAAIYIGAAMPRSPVRRETVVFLGKQITGVDQRRGGDLADLRHDNRSVRLCVCACESAV